MTREEVQDSLSLQTWKKWGNKTQALLEITEEVCVCLTLNFIFSPVREETRYNGNLRVITTFVIYGVFVGICHLLLQNNIATALFISGLDYCSSLFRNIAIRDIKNYLLRIQNFLAKVVTRSPPFTHSKPLIKSLGFLSNIVSSL